MRRAGLGPADRAQVKEAYRILYRSGLNVKQALAQMRETFAQGPGLEIIEFVEAAKRGICPWVEDASEAVEAAES
jgi:UDP-N-acetylglucosamine acyltransferase